MFEEMLEELKEVMNTLLADDEMFDLIAKVLKRTYDALIKAGFSEDAAVRIVAAQGSGVKVNG